MKKMMVFLKPYWFFVGIALLFLFVELRGGACSAFINGENN